MIISSHEIHFTPAPFALTIGVTNIGLIFERHTVIMRKPTDNQEVSA